MKTLLIFALLLITSYVHATPLTAKPLKELLQKIERGNFTYKETGKIFGFMTTHSCLYVSSEIAIFKNYCFPVRKYPARGYTIISKEHGMIDLYQEEATGILKRDIKISEFPEILGPELTRDLQDYTLVEFSNLIEELHYRYYPGCWSTNWSFYTEQAEAGCTDSAAVSGFKEWSQETQSIVADALVWSRLLEAVELRLKAASRNVID